MKDEGLNKRQLSIKTEMPYSTIDNLWKRNTDSMRLPTFRKLCDYFGVTMDSMAYDDQEIVYRSSAPAASPEDNSCVPDLVRLNTAGREKVKEYAADLAENENYKKDIESSRKEAM
jgi:DNA-binding Xre family transcriptional regulator